MVATFSQHRDVADRQRHDDAEHAHRGDLHDGLDARPVAQAQHIEGNAQHHEARRQWIEQSLLQAKSRDGVPCADQPHDRVAHDPDEHEQHPKGRCEARRQGLGDEGQNAVLVGIVDRDGAQHPRHRPGGDDHQPPGAQYPGAGSILRQRRHHEDAGTNQIGEVVGGELRHPDRVLPIVRRAPVRRRRSAAFARSCPPVKDRRDGKPQGRVAPSPPQGQDRARRSSSG